MELRPRGNGLQRPMRQVVVVMPSAFTLANLFFGFWAIISAYNGNFRWAGWFIVFAGILDVLDGRILVRQIAGLIARRIITDHPVGTAVQQGQRLGMIRFGSRVDLFLPTDARVLMQRGMRTRCGQTVVARWN